MKSEKPSKKRRKRKTWIPRFPLLNRPTMSHKGKKDYNRKKEKKFLRHIMERIY